MSCSTKVSPCASVPATFEEFSSVFAEELFVADMFAGVVTRVADSSFWASFFSSRFASEFVVTGLEVCGAFEEELLSGAGKSSETMQPERAAGHEMHEF